MLTLIQGPAGSGKSQLAADLLQSGAVRVLLDITALWAAMSGARRGPDGKYPLRLADDPALAAAFYTQFVIARWALREGHDVAVTTSRRNQQEVWRQLAADAGADFSVQTVDPGRAVVEDRLREPDGSLSEECQRAIERWYG